MKITALFLLFATAAAGSVTFETDVPAETCQIKNVAGVLTSDCNITGISAPCDSCARLSKLEAYTGSVGAESSLATSISGLEAEIVKMKKDILHLMEKTNANAEEIEAMKPPAIDDGLLAKYEFEGNAADSSGNGYTGTQHGGSYVASDIRGTAYSVNSGSRIEVDGFRNHQWGSAFSVCTWFKRASSDGRYQGIVSTGYGSHGVWEIRMGREDGGTMLGGTIWPQNDNSGEWTFGYSPARINAAVGQWHHVCMTWDGSVSNYYLDGVLRDSTINSGNVGNGDSGPIPAKNKPVYIGIAGPNHTGEYFSGEIDNTRLYSRAVTKEDVALMFADKL